MSLIKKIYIGLFAVLYLCVAFTSTLHAIEFFGLANASWLAIILAISFELGQAAVLFELLTSKKDRTKIMPWVLMTIFTLVQVLGNVYSSYKYILLNSPENLRYFKEPIFIWTQLPDEQATVIVTYIVGAILPICALLLTSMITNQLEPESDIKPQEEPIKQEIEKIDSEIKQEDKLEEESLNENESIIEEDQETENINDDEIIEDKKEIEEVSEEVEEIFNKQTPIDYQKSSHFVNLK